MKTKLININILQGHVDIMLPLSLNVCNRNVIHVILVEVYYMKNMLRL